MNLTEMRKKFATKAGVSQEKAKELIAALEEVVINGLIEDNKVVFGAIGSLSIRETKERNGHNPATGEKIMIKAGKKVAYKQSKAIKEMVNFK
ncbi:HU family DNA-binding protein [uncultured Clostridium sp.]|uniref:HU family DNA-binding protein n=1 Tax=uncultured Clostridium sp. TaxID=59620 RepID=UPI00262E178A|nr:HU family DNA-binding protein [uncultured Clostridium sp.]